MTAGTVRTFLIAAFLSAAVLAGCAGPSAERKKEADARMRMGVTFLDQRNLPMAMRELARAAELDPDNPEIEMTLGLAWQARGDSGKAEEHLRRAVALKPDYAEARNNLGIVLAGRKKWDDAVREFEAAAANPVYTTPERAYFNLGEVYRAKGDREKAEAAYRKSVEADGRYAPSWLGLSWALADQGKLQEAAAVLSRCLEIIPDHAPAWMELGRVYLRLSRPADALKAFQNVLAYATDPESRKQAGAYVTRIDPEKR